MTATPSIMVRVLFQKSLYKEELYSDLEFPALPRIGEAISVPEGKRGEFSVWIVSKVGYHYTDLQKSAFPRIEVEQFEGDGVAPSGYYDRIVEGR